jgi:hypothetical protein
MVLASQTRDTQADARSQRAELQRQETLIVAQQDRLLNLRLSDDIDQDAFARKHTEYILDGTIDDDALALHFDGLKRVEGDSKLGDFHYLPVLFHEGRQVKKEQKLLLEVYGVVLSGLQGRAPAFGVIWHGRECKATKVKLNPDRVLYAVPKSSRLLVQAVFTNFSVRNTLQYGIAAAA